MEKYILQTMGYSFLWRLFFVEKLENLLRIKDLLLFFEEVSNKKVELIDILPQIQMVFDFFSGIQKEQYDEARKALLIYDNNEDYIEKNDELIVVVDELKLIFSKETFMQYVCNHNQCFSTTP